MSDLTVFISYRRADSSADAGRLYDALRRRFGRENLFMDVDSLRPGEDWVEAVEGAVARCDVLLAVIGPDWVTIADNEGNQRLSKELDRVRLEIETSLRHNKPVIPVLVQGAPMPTSDQLPESLYPLLRRHAMRISHVTFESDLTHLVTWLRRIDRAHQPKEDVKAAAGAKPLVLTPAPEPALPAPPPDTTVTPIAPVGPIAPPPPPPASLTAQAYPSAPIPPPAYVAPAPAYAYTPPAYPYAPPAKRSGPSGVLIGLIALVAILILGAGAMYALHIGPFAVAVASPTPSPSRIATPPSTPPIIPPTATTVPPTPTAAPPTIGPTLSAAPPTAGASAGAFDALWAVVPDSLRATCEEDSSFGTRLYCFVGSVDSSFWYEAFPDINALNEEYASWLDYRNLDKDVANCFTTPMPLPCEGPYAFGDGPTAGRVAGLVDGDSGWLYWTHDQGLIFGEGLMSIGDGDTFEDLFTYWSTDASKLKVTPSPTP